MKIKSLLITIVVIFSVFTISACKKDKKENRDYDEAEVIAAAKELIKKSEAVNEIYYGYGIEGDTSDVNNSDGNYFPADILSTEKFGVETVEDIKTLTRECYTSAYSEVLINTVLFPTKDESGSIIDFARYYQKYDTLDTSKPLCIMVYSKYDRIWLTDKIEYLYDTVRVSGVDGEIIKVSITVNVTNSEGHTETKDIEIDILEEKNGFRLDEPTYVRHSYAGK